MKINTLIFYFSGTNNTKYLALKLNDYFKDSQIIFINQKLIDQHSKFIAENIFVLYPTYAYGLPRILHSFLKKIELESNYKALISTGGSSSGNSFSQSLRYKNKFDYYFFIKSIENFKPIFNSPTDKKIIETLNLEDNSINILINQLENKENKKIKPFHLLGFINYAFLFFRPLLSQAIHQNKNCIGCKKCITYCLNGAISFNKNNIVIDRKICELCQGCLNKCEKNGLSLFRHSSKTIQYLHSLDISDFD